LAADPAHRVRLWSAREETGRRLRETRENERLLPGIAIPAAVELTTDPVDAVDAADCWVVAVPTAFLRPTVGRFASVRREDVPVVSLTKGIEVVTFRRPSEIIGETLGTENLAVLSGPSHAEEVARGLPTSVVAAAADMGLAMRV